MNGVCPLNDDSEQEGECEHYVLQRHQNKCPNWNTSAKQKNVSIFEKNAKYQPIYRPWRYIGRPLITTRYFKGAFFVGQNPVEQKLSKFCICFQAHSSVPSAMKSFTYVHGYLSPFMANIYYSIFFFKDIWLCKPLLTINILKNF